MSSARRRPLYLIFRRELLRAMPREYRRRRRGFSSFRRFLKCTRARGILIEELPSSLCLIDIKFN